jgi:hypothetical protein
MARYFLPVFVLFLLAQQLSAQCSDAGACVIGGAPMDAQHHSVTVNYVFGSSGGDEALTFHGIQIDGVVGLYEDAALIIRLPYTSIDGPLGSSSGIGDLTLLWRQGLWSDHGSRLSLQVGGKLATGPVNEGGLPQAYQPGLGTNDVIAGLSYETAQWMFAAGYQLSTGRSENAVNRLERGDDLFARAGYSYADVEDLTLGLEVIAIKRLGEDNIRYMIGELDSFVDVADSDQMQVNVLGKAAYSLAANISVVGQVAVPLMQRDVNIDGLKRALSIAAGAQFSF